MEDGNFYFYTTPNGLLRLDKVSGEKKILDISYADNLNLYDGWLYYLASGCVWRMRTDGDNRQKVAQGAQEFCAMYLADGVAWLACEQEPGTYQYTLLRADMGSWQMQRVASGLCYKGYTFKNGWLYYRDGTDQYFYKKKLGGTGKRVLLSRRHLSSPVLSGGWVYGYTPDNEIWRVKADGNAQEEVYRSDSAVDISGMNIINDTIYFYSGYQAAQKGSIKSVGIDGTGYRQLFEASLEGHYFQCINFLKGRMAVAYCEGTHMTGTVCVDLRTGGQEFFR